MTALGDLLNHEPPRLCPGASSGRWGGEEFMVLLPDRTIERAGMLADVLKTSFSAEDFGSVGHVTVSIGYTQYNGHESADAMVRRVFFANFHRIG